MGLNYINDYELVNGYAVIDNDFNNNRMNVCTNSLEYQLNSQ